MRDGLPVRLADGVLPPAFSVDGLLERVSLSVRKTATGGRVWSPRYAAAFEHGRVELSPGDPVEEDVAAGEPLSAPRQAFRTLSVFAGEKALYTADPARPAPCEVLGNTAQSLLSDRAGLVEYYEARFGGVEVSWVFQQRPPPADVTIFAEVEDAAEGEVTERGLRFAALDGGSALRVSKPVAVDSRGQRWPLAMTSPAKGRVRILVPASVLASAVFPLAIDPVLEFENSVPEADPPASPPDKAQVPYIAGSPDQGYLLVYAEQQEFVNSYKLLTVRVGSDGEPIDAEGHDLGAFWLYADWNGYAGGFQDPASYGAYPVVLPGESGKFLVMWVQAHDGDGTFPAYIFYSVVDAAGASISSSLPVEYDTGGVHPRWHLAGTWNASNDLWMVTWTDTVRGDMGTSLSPWLNIDDVFGGRITSSGTVVGAAFLIFADRRAPGWGEVVYDYWGGNGWRGWDNGSVIYAETSVLYDAEASLASDGTNVLVACLSRNNSNYEWPGPIPSGYCIRGRVLHLDRVNHGMPSFYVQSGTEDAIYATNVSAVQLGRPRVAWYPHGGVYFLSWVTTSNTLHLLKLDGAGNVLSTHNLGANPFGSTYSGLGGWDGHHFVGLNDKGVPVLYDGGLNFAGTFSNRYDDVVAGVDRVMSVTLTNAPGSAVLRPFVGTLAYAPLPRVSIQPTNPIAEQAAVLSAAASTNLHPNRPITGYEWDMDNNGSYETTGVVIAHAYLSQGIHTGRLRVTSQDTGTLQLQRTTMSFTAPVGSAVVPMSAPSYDAGSGMLQISYDVEGGESYDVYYSADPFAASPAWQPIEEGTSDGSFSYPPDGDFSYFRVVKEGDPPDQHGVWIAQRPTIPAGFTVMAPPSDGDRRFDGAFGALLAADLNGDDGGVSDQIGDEVFILEANQTWRNLYLDGQGVWRENGGAASTYELAAGQGFLLLRNSATASQPVLVGPVGNQGVATNVITDNGGNGAWNVVTFSQGKVVSLSAAFGDAVQGVPEPSWDETASDMVVAQNPNGSWRRIMRAGDGTWFDLSTFAVSSLEFNPGAAVYYFRQPVGPLKARF